MSKIFYSIKEASNETGLSQYHLRNGCRDGSIPHLRVGAKFMVNLPMLIQKMNEESQTREEDINA